MEFEAYLISKKIDSAEFQKHEPSVWAEWKSIFDEMHPSSFTMQKLNLINPIRRKYQLKVVPVAEKVAPEPKQETPGLPGPTSAAASPAKPAKPVFKPRPKLK